jgi:3-hydroxyisobutyrate dehydrogenase
MDLSKISGLGFVGLGAMGLPMAGHLAAKLPESVHIFVYDINQASMDQLQQDFPSRITKCSGAKDVADKSVSEAGTTRPISIAHTDVTLADTGIRKSF